MHDLLAQVRRLVSRLRKGGTTREEAEDLVQEAFLRMALYCEQGNSIRHPEAFLARTVRNLAINAFARERIRAKAPEAVEELELVDLGPSPDEEIAAEQCLYRIQACLTAVSPRTRDIFLMHRLHGLSYAQLAEHFDLSISAIEKHIAKAMAALGPEMYRLQKERRQP